MDTLPSLMLYNHIVTKKTLESSDAHNRKIAKSTHLPQNPPNLWINWLLDWLPFPLNVDFDLKWQSMNMHELPMLEKCLRRDYFKQQQQQNNNILNGNKKIIRDPGFNLLWTEVQASAPYTHEQWSPQRK